jgi:uncharacterized membrane protein
MRPVPMVGGEPGNYERDGDPARVLTLSDGVFAIILTLLVLEVHVPDVSGQRLTEALREVRPSLVAFLISFVVVAIAWAGHRDLFSLIRHTDRTLVWLNLVYLLPVSLIPFGASLLARYSHKPVALEIYGMLLVAIAATRLGTWLYATGKPSLLSTPVPSRSRLMGSTIVYRGRRGDRLCGCDCSGTFRPYDFPRNLWSRSRVVLHRWRDCA